MDILVTHPIWLGAVCENELRHLGYTCRRDGHFLRIGGKNWEDVYRINLWSRIANRVFVIVAEQKMTDFDVLFDCVVSCNRKQYIAPGQGIRVLAQSRDSQLSSTRTIQAIAHKAICTQLTGSRDILWELGDGQIIQEITVSLVADVATVMLNTSGASLHERGYRTEQGEAPLKENIAAGLLLLSHWDRKSSLYDPFCGAGTICIEAALMAKNIAPWLQRQFSFEGFPVFDGIIRHNIKKNSELSPAARDGVKVQSSDVENHHCIIFWSDIDAGVLSKAQANAKRAGVADMIHFVQKDFREQKYRSDAWCVTNPPYGVRLTQGSDDLSGEISGLFEKYSLHGGFLYLRGNIIAWFSDKKMLNWQQEVSFFVK